MIERRLTVRVPVAQAWRTWTERIDLWWPRDHRPGGGQVALEPGVGGSIHLQQEDGRTEVGRIRVWEPPHRLGYDFFLGSSVDLPSAVEIAFLPVPDGTEVHVQHHQGAVPEALWTSSVQGYRRAWPALFDSFTAILESP